MSGRSEVAEVLRQLNDIQNRRPELSIDETIAGIDSVMADDVEGWSNGVTYRTAKPSDRTSA